MAKSNVIIINFNENFQDKSSINQVESKSAREIKVDYFSSYFFKKKLKILNNLLF